MYASVLSHSVCVWSNNFPWMRPFATPVWLQAHKKQLTDCMIGPGRLIKWFACIIDESVSWLFDDMFTSIVCVMCRSSDGSFGCLTQCNCVMQAARPAGSTSPEQAGSQNRPSAAGPPTLASDDLAEVKKQVAMLERELADSERTHQLRSAAFWFGLCLPQPSGGGVSIVVVVWSQLAVVVQW